MAGYQVPDLAKKYIEHDMIAKYTSLPPFSHHRTRLLYLFLKYGQRPGSRNAELYALVTALIQLGLDTHDQVDPSELPKDKKSMRSKQLKVLAGDYFSSRFYQLLSMAGDIDMVRLLSQTVCEINRLKTQLYLRMDKFKMTAEEYLQGTVAVKEQLYLIFAGGMDRGLRKQWTDLLHAITHCEVISEEIQRGEKIDSFYYSWGFWHVLQQGSLEETGLLMDKKLTPLKWRSILLKYNVTSILHQKLDAQLREISRLIRQLDPETLRSELQKIGEPFVRGLSVPKVMEES